MLQVINDFLIKLKSNQVILEYVNRKFQVIMVVITVYIDPLPEMTEHSYSTLSIICISL